MCTGQAVLLVALFMFMALAIWIAYEHDQLQAELKLLQTTCQGGRR
jgi:hypothetical protein